MVNARLKMVSPPKIGTHKGSCAPVVGFSYIVKNITKFRCHLQCGGIKQRQNMTVWAKEKFKETPHDNSPACAAAGGCRPLVMHNGISSLFVVKYFTPPKMVPVGL